MRVPMLMLSGVLAHVACGAAPQPDDVLDALLATDGVLSVEALPDSPDGYPAYRLVFEQPVDHDDPRADRFGQHLTLVHRAWDAPMVLVSTGYHDYLGSVRAEPAALLHASQLVVEHRYFDASRPAPTPWEHLTIEQAAADHHRVVEALKPLYSGPWISTGASKGGMASVYHRRFYPDDVAATIAYVTPHSLDAPDPRYADFLGTVGDPVCRQRVRSLQREALERRAGMEALAQVYAAALGHTFERLGGIAPATETAIASFEWAFWQYLGAAWCDDLPERTARDSEIFNALTRTRVVDMTSDRFLDLFEPYYYQIHTQLGYPQMPVAHLEDLLVHEVPGEAYLPEGVTVEHDPAAMLDIATWVRSEATEILFVYGAYDPWTGGAFEVEGNERVRSFVVDAGTHAATLVDLDPAALAEALALLATWTGTDAQSAALTSRHAASAPLRWLPTPPVPR